MLLFAFDRALFKFNAPSPAFAPLFQLPPRRGRRDRQYQINPVANWNGSALSTLRTFVPIRQSICSISRIFG